MYVPLANKRTQIGWRMSTVGSGCEQILFYFFFTAVILNLTFPMSGLQSAQRRKQKKKNHEIFSKIHVFVSSGGCAKRASPLSNNSGLQDACRRVNQTVPLMWTSTVELQPELLTLMVMMMGGGVGAHFTAQTLVTPKIKSSGWSKLLNFITHKAWKGDPISFIAGLHFW